MGFDAAVTLFGKDEEERKVSIPCNPFDFRGADFDMTTDDTEGTYFKYLPFGEDEEGRKMPYKIEKR